MSRLADKLMVESRREYAEKLEKGVWKVTHNGTLRMEDGSPKFAQHKPCKPHDKAARKLASRVKSWENDKSQLKSSVRPTKPGSMKIGGGW